MGENISVYLDPDIIDFVSFQVMNFCRSHHDEVLSLGSQPTFLLCQEDSSFHLIRHQQFFTVIHSTVLDVFGPEGGQYSQEG